MFLAVRAELELVMPENRPPNPRDPSKDRDTVYLVLRADVKGKYPEIVISLQQRFSKCGA